MSAGKKTTFLLVLVFLMLQAQAQLSCYHFLVDAGHGGSDPGSTCANGVAEKVLTLDMCQKLKANLQSKGGSVSMTRSTDVFVSLTDRRNFINNENPDAAISIHLNAYNGVVQGTETFWCAGTPSSTLAGLVHPQLVSAIGYNDRGVKNTCFTVLTTNSAIPTILTEALFHDEPNGCTFINNQTNQTNIAQAHALGIVNYLPACNPVGNDLCDNATLLQSQTSCVYSPGTLSGATANSMVKPSCDGFSNPARKDVFFSFFASDTLHTIEVVPAGIGADAVDAVIAVYSGPNCNALTEIACTGGTGGGGGQAKTFSVSPLVSGQKYWIRIYDYGVLDPLYPDFELCVTHSGTTVGNSSNQEPLPYIYLSETQQGNVTINSEFTIKQLTVSDISGRIIFTTSNHSNRPSIDFSTYRNGMYFIHIIPAETNNLPVVLKYLHQAVR